MSSPLEVAAAAVPEPAQAGASLPVLRAVPGTPFVTPSTPGHTGPTAPHCWVRGGTVVLPLSEPPALAQSTGR